MVLSMQSVSGRRVVSRRCARDFSWLGVEIGFTSVYYLRKKKLQCKYDIGTSKIDDGGIPPSWATLEEFLHRHSLRIALMVNLKEDVRGANSRAGMVTG